MRDAAPLDGVFAVVNTTAGSGRAGRIWPSVASTWEARGLRVEHGLTRYAGHAAEIAADAARAGWPAVVAVGGDGTLHEAANGIMQVAEADGITTRLGVVPCGSGNDFARALGVSALPMEAALGIVRPRERSVDVGRANGRFFVNGVGVGFDARVAARAKRVPLLTGAALYGVALVAELGANTPSVLRLLVDGAEVFEGPVTMVTISNGFSHGGGFLLCPDARPDDGALDVLVVTALPRRRVLRLLVRSLGGTHPGLDGIRFHRGARVEVTSPDLLEVHVDGEILEGGVRRLDIELLPKHLKVLA